MTTPANQIRKLLGDRAQEVAGRVIALVDGVNVSLVNADGTLTAAGEAMLTVDEPADVPARAARKRTAKKADKPTAAELGVDELVDLDDLPEYDPDTP